MRFYVDTIRRPRGKRELEADEQETRGGENGKGSKGVNERELKAAGSIPAVAFKTPAPPPRGFVTNHSENVFPSLSPFSPSLYDRVA